MTSGGARNKAAAASPLLALLLRWLVGWQLMFSSPSASEASVSALRGSSNGSEPSAGFRRIRRRATMSHKRIGRPAVDVCGGLAQCFLFAPNFWDLND
eukprot:scaffold32427_cov112-Isochrysis_galbana.AAC.1